MMKNQVDGDDDNYDERLMKMSSHHVMKRCSQKQYVSTVRALFIIVLYEQS